MQVILSNSLSTVGEKILTLQNETANLQKENESIRNEITERQSLTFIETKALAMGFSKINQKLSISAPIPVALKP